MRFFLLGVLLLSGGFAYSHNDTWRGEDEIEVGMFEINHVYDIEIEQNGLKHYRVVNYKYSQLIYWEQCRDYDPHPIWIWYPAGYNILNYEDKNITKEIINKHITHPMRDFSHNGWFIFLGDRGHNNVPHIKVTSKILKETHTIGDAERMAKKKYGSEKNGLSHPWVTYQEQKRRLTSRN